MDDDQHHDGWDDDSGDRCAVIGAGSWGTALGSVLASKGRPVTAWDVDPDVVAGIAGGENVRYLPGIALPPTLTAVGDVAQALGGARLVVLTVPSPVVRPVARSMAPLLEDDAVLCCAVKGVELGTLSTMSEVLQAELPERRHRSLVFLSGPSFAKEVALGLPTAVTVAGTDEQVTASVQRAFHTAAFRPYTTSDVMGVELGGCVKNVIAIAAGMADGLDLGANARAALITRGLAEMTRLAVARGAQPLTLMGLAGLGDLVLTCSSTLSRNYRVGLAVGQGRDLAEVQAELGQVAEGVVNARSTVAMARRWKVDMPISATVDAVLHEGLDPREAGRLLMTREPKPELL